MCTSMLYNASVIHVAMFLATRFVHKHTNAVVFYAAYNGTNKTSRVVKHDAKTSVSYTAQSNRVFAMLIEAKLR